MTIAQDQGTLWIGAVDGDPVSMKFWAKVQAGPYDRCWPWRGVRTRQGYGRFRLNGRSHSCTRYSYEQHYGAIQPRVDGQPWVLCHKCDNPPCVNPMHLFIGTHKDNARDKIRKGRWRVNV